jgi:L-ascorbate metabolism protein UlaG (beta-lactamase superfamily)
MNMKKVLIAGVVVLFILVGYFFFGNDRSKGIWDDTVLPSQDLSQDTEEYAGNVFVTPISHATMVLSWGDIVIYNDPVGGSVAFEGMEEPDIVFVTDVHGDHLDIETLESVVTLQTALVVPQAVADQLPDSLSPQTVVLANGETVTQKGIFIQAMPMYNLPESDDSRHVKGRGNGYLLEREGIRVYIAGDTADIPEMRSLTEINFAFVPMNLPYTMDIESAADAVLDFKPHTVYPYHYRGQDGNSDIRAFKDIVQAGNPDINVVLLEWYPTR